MKKFIAVLVAGLFAAGTFAQSAAPVQPARAKPAMKHMMKKAKKAVKAA